MNCWKMTIKSCSISYAYINSNKSWKDSNDPNWRVVLVTISDMLLKIKMIIVPIHIILANSTFVLVYRISCGINYESQKIE
jgi:hypothetical protein